MNRVPAAKESGPRLGDLARELSRMAVRNVSRNGRRSALTGFTIGLGVAAFLFAKAYVGGLHRLIEEQVVEAGYGALQVQRQGYGGASEMAPLHLDLPGGAGVRARIASVPGVRAVAPRLRFAGLVAANDNSSAFAGFGFSTELEPAVCPRGPAARTERLAGPGFSGDDAEEVVLGITLARSLGVRVGDTVTLLVQTRAGSLEAADASVVGLYRFDDVDLNKRTVVTPLMLAQRLVHMPGRVTSFAVALEEGADLEETAAQVRRAMAEEPLRTETLTWGELVPRYRDVMRLQDAVLEVVLVLVFILAVAGVTNTMLMAVFERTREIGTLLSLGFRPGRVVALFLLEAGALGIVSATLGAIAGVALTALAARWGIPFQVPGIGEVLNRPVQSWPFVAVAVAGAAVGCVGGGLYPALRAARLRPVEALTSL